MKLTIDGKEIRSAGGRTLLEVARENGIRIPSLCDHPRLIPFSGCRLCLVQVEGRGRYVPACSTEVEDGMRVATQTPELQELRRQILELILIEHPNACLVCTEKRHCDELKSSIRKVGEVTGCVLCPNNGRCDLQKIVAELQVERVSFPSVYRGLEIKRSDPFFDRNFNLCILCGRCVRICSEVRGLATLTFARRGADTVVGTVLDKSLIDANCQFCGACVDVCPTGALTERAVKYEPLPDSSATTICPLCSIGCEMDVARLDGRILNTRPSGSSPVNQDQACVKGRFVLKDVVYASQRIPSPLLRKGAHLEPVAWEEALDVVAAKLKAYGPGEIALVGSQQWSLEDEFVFSRFAAEVVETENVCRGESDSTLAVYRGVLRESALEPKLNFRLGDVGQARAILLLGTNLAASHPMLWLEVLRAVRGGARLVIVGPTEYLFTRHAWQWLKTTPGTEALVLAGLSKLLLEANGKRAAPRLAGLREFQNTLAAISIDDIAGASGAGVDALRQVAEWLLTSEKTMVLFGADLTGSPNARNTLAAVWNLALQTRASLVPLAQQNNSRGLFELGRTAAANGKTPGAVLHAVASGAVKALYLAGPFRLDGQRKPELLVVQDSHMNGNAAIADAVLPATTFAESEGVYVNAEGRVQRAQAVIAPLGEARPDWWILTQLSGRLKSAGLGYSQNREICADIARAALVPNGLPATRPGKNRGRFLRERPSRARRFLPLTLDTDTARISQDHPILLRLEDNLDFYRGLVLSEAIKGFRVFRDQRWVYVNPDDADKLGLKNGDRVEVSSPGGHMAGVARLSPLVSTGQAAAAFSRWECAGGPPSNLVPVRIESVKP